MSRASAVGIPRTEEQILAWLESLISKRYDTEETAVHAIEEYRDAIVKHLDSRIAESRDGYSDTGPAFSMLVELRAMLGGAS